MVRIYHSGAGLFSFEVVIITPFAFLSIPTGRVLGRKLVILYGGCPTMGFGILAHGAQLATPPTPSHVQAPLWCKHRGGVLRTAICNILFIFSSFFLGCASTHGGKQGRGVCTDYSTRFQGSIPRGQNLQFLTPDFP